MQAMKAKMVPAAPNIIEVVTAQAEGEEYTSEVFANMADVETRRSVKSLAASFEHLYNRIQVPPKAPCPIPPKSGGPPTCAIVLGS